MTNRTYQEAVELNESIKQRVSNSEKLLVASSISLVAGASIAAISFANIIPVNPTSILVLGLFVSAVSAAILIYGVKQYLDNSKLIYGVKQYLDNSKLAEQSNSVENLSYEEKKLFNLFPEMSSIFEIKKIDFDEALFVCGLKKDNLSENSLTEQVTKILPRLYSRVVRLKELSEPLYNSVSELIAKHIEAAITICKHQNWSIEDVLIKPLSPKKNVENPDKATYDNGINRVD